MLSLSAGSRFLDAGRVLWTGTKTAFRARRPRQSASYTRNNTFFKERSVLWRKRFGTTLVSFPCLRKTYSFWDHPQLHTSGLKSTERQPDFWSGSKLDWFYSRLNFMFICYSLFFLLFGTIRPPPLLPTPAMSLAQWIYMREPAEQLNRRPPDCKLLEWIYNRFCFFCFFLLHSRFALIPWRDAFSWRFYRTLFTGRFYRTFLEDAFTGRFYRTCLQDVFTGRFYRTLLQDVFTGRFYRTFLQDAFRGRFYRTFLQDAFTGRF